MVKNVRGLFLRMPSTNINYLPDLQLYSSTVDPGFPETSYGWGRGGQLPKVPYLDFLYQNKKLKILGERVDPPLLLLGFSIQAVWKWLILLYKKYFTYLNTGCRSGDSFQQRQHHSRYGRKHHRTENYLDIHLLCGDNMVLPEEK